MRISDWSSDVCSSDLVSAVHAIAAVIEGGEQVVPALMPKDERRLDGIGGTGGDQPAGDRIGLGTGPGLARRGIEGEQLDPGPETAQCEPLAALRIDDKVGEIGRAHV